MKFVALLLSALWLRSTEGQGPNLVTGSREMQLYTFYGCFKDRVNGVRTMDLYSLSYTSLEDCMDGCAAQGYNFFAHQWKWQCWCSGKNSKTDRVFAKQGRKSESDCQCDSTTNVGGDLNCVYKIWPKAQTKFLPEASCITRVDSATGELAQHHCGWGGKGTSVWYSNEKNQVVYKSGQCLEMRVVDNKTKLFMATCDDNKTSQKIDVENDCLNGVCSAELQGAGFYGQCAVDNSECFEGKIHNYDVRLVKNHINLGSCAMAKQLDPEATTGEYYFRSYGTRFCDFDLSPRISSPSNANLGLYHMGVDQPIRLMYSAQNFDQFTILDPSGYICWNGDLSKCLCVDAIGYGATVRLWSATSTNQWNSGFSEEKCAWLPRNDGSIRLLKHANYCMDVLGGAVVNGAYIAVWSCHFGPGQRFNWF